MSIVNIESTNDMSSLQFAYYGSTNLERKGIRGISHLMEHLVCQKFSDMENDFERDCIEFNAYTEDNKIVFYFNGLEECLSKYRNKIIRRMYKPIKLTKKMIEEEKRIVLQEMDESFKDIGITHYCLFFRRCYDHYTPLGSTADIQSITLDDCKEFYDVQYNVPDKIISKSKTYTLVLGDEYKFGDRKGKRRKLKLKKNVNNIEIELYKKAFGSDIKNIFMVKEISKKDAATARIVASIFDGSSLTSPLMDEVREKRGLVYGISFSSDLICDNNFMMLSTVTSDRNVDEVIRVINEVFINYKKYATEERLENIIHSQKVSIKINNCYGIIKDEDLGDLEAEFRQKLDTINLEEVHSFCEKYLNGTSNFTCVEIF